MHLLCADDHRGVAEGIGALLAGEFDPISYAFTLEEAELAMAESIFDLIMLDLDFRRPDRNGFSPLVLRWPHPHPGAESPGGRLGQRSRRGRAYPGPGRSIGIAFGLGNVTHVA